MADEDKSWDTILDPYKKFGQGVDKPFHQETYNGVTKAADDASNAWHKASKAASEAVLGKSGGGDFGQKFKKRVTTDLKAPIEKVKGFFNPNKPSGTGGGF